jgi:hypothetical protein
MDPDLKQDDQAFWARLFEQRETLTPRLPRLRRGGIGHARVILEPGAVHLGLFRDRDPSWPRLGIQLVHQGPTGQARYRERVARQETLTESLQQALPAHDRIEWFQGVEPARSRIVTARSAPLPWDDPTLVTAQIGWLLRAAEAFWTLFAPQHLPIRP